MACASNEQGKNDGACVTDHLNCPICLEVFKSPRALACLHTFCETCIESYIVKETEKRSDVSAIQCPVCRKETEPPAPNKPATDWARELPLNYALLPMLESLGAQKESSRVCDNCARDGKTKLAKSYCSTCKEYQCSDCVELHSKLTILVDHKLIGMQEQLDAEETVTTVDLGKLEYCQVHVNKKIKYLCQDHDVFCCSTCAIVKHRKCNQVMELARLGQDLRGGTKPKTLQSDMEHSKSELGNLTEILETNSTAIESQSDAIIQEMKEVRSKILKMVDRLVDHVTQKCNELKKQHSTTIADQIFHLRSLIAAISSSCSLLNSVMKHGTVTQVYIAFHKLQDQARQYQESVKEARDNTRTVELHLDLSKDIEALIQSDISLAAVSVKETGVGVEEPAARKPVPLAECDMEKLPLVYVKQRPQQSQINYHGSVYLPDGRLVTTDYNNHLCCLLDDSYAVTADIKLPSNPTSLAVIGEAEVAVVVKSSTQIQCIAVGRTLTLTRTIACQRQPCCIARLSDTELVVDWDTGLGTITLGGEERKYFRSDKAGNPINFQENDRIAVDVRRSRIYRSNCNTNTVSCLGLDGEVYFTYSGGLQYPAGIALDRDGNVYVCSYLSRSVHQVSPEGLVIRVIDTGMDLPFTVCFRPGGDEMLVMNGGYTYKALRVRFVPPAVRAVD